MRRRVVAPILAAAPSATADGAVPVAQIEQKLAQAASPQAAAK